MKNRPLFKKSIVDLEGLFQLNGSNPDSLKELLGELNHRNTNRASKLKSRVEGAIEGNKSKVIRKAKTKPLNVDKLSPPKAPQPVPLPEDSVHSEPVQKAHRKHAGPKPPVTNKPEEILRAWTALEVLSPQGYRRKTDLTGGDPTRIASIVSGELPWERGEKSRPNKRLYYEVILGTINLGPAVEALLKVYADNRPDKPRTNQHVAIASVVIDKEGRPLEDEVCFAISSFAWGVSKALEGDLKPLADWPLVERELRSNFQKRLFKRDRDGEILPLDLSSINGLYNHLVGALDLAGQDVSPPDFAIRRYEFFASKIPPEPSLLNSFFLEDLAEARNLITVDNAPDALQLYLGQGAPERRLDLLQDDSGLRDILSPASTPCGRWPTAGRFPLAMLQQAAVNGTSTELNDSGVLSVNGPPGTGKTTLLRDIVATRIVGRAEVMVGYKNPAHAFKGSREVVQRKGAKITLQRLDPRLKGFEMVVASSNNKAVENVSAELPGIEAIAEDAPGLRYFKSISDKILGKETWGLIAAVLGNSSNRYHFSQSFWRDEEHGLSTYLNHAAGSPQYVMEPQEDGPPKKRLRSVVVDEHPPNNVREAQTRWRKACSDFEEALAKFRATQSELQRVHEAVVEIPKIVSEQRRLTSSLIQLEETVARARDRATAAQKHAMSVNSELQTWKTKQAANRMSKPGFFAKFFGLSRYKEWRNMDRSLSAEVADYSLKSSKARSDLNRLNGELAAENKLLLSTNTKLELLDKKRVQLEGSLEHFRENSNACIPDNAFFTGDHDKIQKSHLWFDDASTLERDLVFEAAMAVHRAFVDSAADQIRQNLVLLTESFGTRSFGTSAKDALIPDLWATFFLVVPVVSTTFASVRRMFSRLPPESLGWLLVDEAGQAVPQAAVGAIMRSKRVVAVGDPLQIKPVVTLPKTLTEEICGFFGVNPIKHNAPDASVQTLADTASPFCAQFQSGSGHRDVGSPLLVHRRCDSPMFDISNEIAYANLMVQAKVPNGEINPLGRSRWIDVKGQSGPDKWCEDEWHALLKCLNELKDAGAPPDIYVVTPFVIVQDNLRKRLLENGILSGWVSTPNSWVYEHVGTVHTVQGREAGSVFFVLGAQSPSQNGARAWAGDKPNIANVAVTRAQSALYVIGNRDLWRTAGVFATLDKHLSY